MKVCTGYKERAIYSSWGWGDRKGVTENLILKLSFETWDSIERPPACLSRGKKASKLIYNGRRDHHDGRGVRCTDHLPSHKYIKNTTICGSTPTEHLLNASRRPQTSQKARNSPHTRIGQMRKGNTETKE